MQMQQFLAPSKGEVMDVDGCEGMMGERYPSMDRVLSDRGSLDWDKQSNSSVSEVSVACLQDRILQMEETHYRCETTFVQVNINIPRIPPLCSIYTCFEISAQVKNFKQRSKS